MDNSTTYVTLVPDPQLYWLRWYHLLGGLWVTQFCIACQHLVIAGSVAGWYFTKYVHPSQYEMYLNLRKRKLFLNLSVESQVAKVVT